jgi:hypothetical protein
MSHGIGPLSPAREGSDVTMWIVAPDPASLLGRAPVPPRVPLLRNLPPFQEGSGAVTHHAVPCGPRASRIKKSLADLPMQLGSWVSKAHMHVSKVADARAIMGLQDMRAGDISNACKTCEHVAIVRLQYCTGPVDHSHDTATVPGDLTGQHHSMDRAQRGRTTRQDIPHAVEDIICYF